MIFFHQISFARVEILLTKENAKHVRFQFLHASCAISVLSVLSSACNCAAGGRGTHTDSLANTAGLYVVSISLGTLSDAPA